MTLKFRNEPQVVDGLKFASKKEARRWGELKLLERAGEIRLLTHQPKFIFTHNDKLICSYVGDFSYINTSDGERIVEDVKSPITRKHPVYRIKNKMMAAFYNIHIREV